MKNWKVARTTSLSTGESDVGLDSQIVSRIAGLVDNVHHKQLVAGKKLESGAEPCRNSGSARK